MENILKKAKPGTDYSIYNLKYKNLEVKTSFYGTRGDSKNINSSFLSINSAGSTGTFSSDFASSYINQGKIDIFYLIICKFLKILIILLQRKPT